MYPASYALAKAAQALPETPLADRIQNAYENITGAKNGKRSEGVEDALESNASVWTNGSPTRRDAQAAGKPANIVAKIRRWIQAPRSA
jgi:hypothetical protein